MLISLCLGILAPRRSSEVTWLSCSLPAGLRGRVSAHSLGVGALGLFWPLGPRGGCFLMTHPGTWAACRCPTAHHRLVRGND